MTVDEFLSENPTEADCEGWLWAELHWPTPDGAMGKIKILQHLRSIGSKLTKPREPKDWTW